MNNAISLYVESIQHRIFSVSYWAGANNGINHLCAINRTGLHGLVNQLCTQEAIIRTMTDY